MARSKARQDDFLRLMGDTRSSFMSKRLQPRRAPSHDALEDAPYQAELFRLIR